MLRRFAVMLVAFIFSWNLSGGCCALADNGLNSAQVAQWQPWFKQVWGADAACGQKENWDTYWDWVQRFFLGYMFNPGWFHDVNEVTLKITALNKRQNAQDELVNLGRKIAGEWAKPNTCRKISRNNLQDWDNGMKAAVAHDSGNGDDIQTQIDSMGKIVDQLLAGASPQ
jgi:hypothetical protein